MSYNTTLALAGKSERKKGTGKPYGKSNHRKVLRMADEMADAAKSVKIDGGRNIPDWAGLAWIISSYYNTSHGKIKEAMGAEWTKRAEMIVKALRR